MVRKMFGLFVDDGSLAVIILAWVFGLNFIAQILFIGQTWAAPVLFLGCVTILIENVLRTSRQPVAVIEKTKAAGVKAR
ncbi:MAG TPA: hypothetical protein VKC61_12855 [Pyrinomonadaceae bacterium]|nr:hypothetical protein [Pyrinomonadaceae bacterium]